MVISEYELTQAEQAIIEHADRYAGKNATLNMRINKHLLEDLKEAAKLEGFEGGKGYQTWLTFALMELVANIQTKHTLENSQ